MRLGLLAPLAGEEDVHRFAAEREQSGEWQVLAGREVVGHARFQRAVSLMRTDQYLHVVPL